MSTSHILFITGLLIILLGTSALAHKPRFIEGPGPFAVREPTISQAFYHSSEEAQTYTFIIPPLDSAVPVEVLVLDDALGQSLAFQALWVCDEQEEQLEQVDVPFFEEFSRIHHRYRISDGVGPSSIPCEVRVTESSGQVAPYVFAIGSIESFDLGDVLGFITLGDKLKAWQAIPGSAGN